MAKQFSSVSNQNKKLTYWNENREKLLSPLDCSQAMLKGNFYLEFKNVDSSPETKYLRL